MRPGAHVQGKPMLTHALVNLELWRQHRPQAVKISSFLHFMLVLHLSKQFLVHTDISTRHGRPPADGYVHSTVFYLLQNVAGVVLQCHAGTFPLFICLHLTIIHINMQSCSSSKTQRFPTTTGLSASRPESLHPVSHNHQICKANSASHLTCMDLKKLLIFVACSLCFPSICSIPGSCSLCRLRGDAALFRCHGLTTACTDKSFARNIRPCRSEGAIRASAFPASI